MEKKYFIEMDKKDPLKEFRNHFFLPKNTIYFDGNSLGMAPKITKKRMEHVIRKEWGQGLIRSWADEEWGISGQRIGNKISKLIGANDGEGASKFITVKVKNCKTEQDAKKVSFSIANSPLVKTAIAGEDPNWGRIIMAIGKADVNLNPNKISIKLGHISIIENGKLVPSYNEYEAAD